LIAVIWEGGRCSWHLVDRGSRLLLTSCNVQDSTHQKNYPALNVNRAEKSCSLRLRVDRIYLLVKILILVKSIHKDHRLKKRVLDVRGERQVDK
jgi:hypothetical protein